MTHSTHFNDCYVRDLALGEKGSMTRPVYGERHSSVVECPLMVRWIIRSIPHGGPTELFLVPVRNKIPNYLSEISM